MAWLGFLIGLWTGAIIMALLIGALSAGREYDTRTEGPGHGAKRG